jgi:hypothetical protein
MTILLLPPRIAAVSEGPAADANENGFVLGAKEPNKTGKFGDHRISCKLLPKGAFHKWSLGSTGELETDALPGSARDWVDCGPRKDSKAVVFNRRKRRFAKPEIASRKGRKGAIPAEGRFGTLEQLSPE